MTHETPEPSSPGKRRRITELFYPMTWQQALRDYQDGILTHRGLLFCYFVIHLRPGTEISVEVDKVCALLGIHTATYYRAIGALKSRGRLNIRRGRMIVGVPEIQPVFEVSQSSERNSQVCEKEPQLSEKDSQVCESPSQLSELNSQNSDPDSQPYENANRLNTLQSNDSRSSANVPKQTDQTFKTNKQPEPTHHPVGCSGIDREAIDASSPGVSGDSVVPSTSILEELSGLIFEAGLKPNKTIQTTLVELISAKDPAAARQVVENALSALQEQQQQGQVRNPGGFLKTALQRGFTANQAKREARSRRQRQSPPDLIQVAFAVEQALANGDSAFALACSPSGTTAGSPKSPNC